jgi:riboflavin kinase/FMN adenylyltransferase
VQTFYSIADFQSEKPLFLTVGTFDGIHLGHQAILSQITTQAQALGLSSAVLTFHPHPRMVLQPNEPMYLLQTIEEKQAVIAELGIDYLIIQPFDSAFSALDAEAYVKQILVDKLHVKQMLVGYDHRFGVNRSADYVDLLTYGTKYGFQVDQLSKQTVEALTISSTEIRNALLKGNVSLAEKLLGRPYEFTGTVVHGKKLGRTIGYPTANIEVNDFHKLVPGLGIYAVISDIDGQMVKGMMSIGTNPTVGGRTRTIEIYYFDFDADLYGKTVTTYCLGYLRAEAKFASLDELKRALEQDADDSYRVFNEKGIH